MKPFTLDHFRKYAAGMVWEDESQREPEDWQLEVARDIFAGHPEVWLIVPEGNGKTTFVGQLALYGLDHAQSPWIPVGAASRDQAKIVYSQAAGFVNRTPDFKERFRAYDGYRKIVSKVNGGEGLVVYGHDPKTGDGVIPFPYAIIDELHRHDDLRLYSLWKGKLRKRGAQILTISTAGEPQTEFENTREEIRRRAADHRERGRNGAYLHAVGNGLALHEYMVPTDAGTEDMEMVKAANPLSTITVEGLAEDYDSPTLELGDWKRLKCNRPTRSVVSAVTDAEWDEAQVREAILAGEAVDCGLDVAWKWDTTALVPLWKGPKFRLLGEAQILIPPRDGSTLHPDAIKSAFFELQEHNPIGDVVMDMTAAEDIASWLEDELHLTVIDRSQGNTSHVADYAAFMEGLRNGTLKHTGDAGLRSHVLNATARRLPGGDHRFDRPVSSRGKDQDRRVIDALTAAAMVVEHSNRKQPPRRSVYEDRSLATV